MTSEPEVDGAGRRGRRAAAGRAGRRSAGADVPSPMAELPAGATFGSLVHARARARRPVRRRPEAELAAQVREQLAWWPVDAAAEDLAAALVPLHDTPLGPLAPGLTLRPDRAAGPAARARLRDPAQPVATCEPGADVRLADVGALLRKHLAADDPLAPYADRLLGTGARRPVAARLPVRLDRRGAAHPGGGRSPLPRRRLQDQLARRPGGRRSPRPTTRRARLAEAMLHSDYPLQALLYVVVAAPLPALAPAGLRPGNAPRRRPLPLRARDVRPRDAGGRRAPRRGVQLAAARRPGDRAVGPARRTEGRMSLLEIEDPRDHRLALQAGGLLRDVQRGGGRRGGRRARRAPADARWPGRPTRPSRSPWRWRCGRSGAARSASTSTSVAAGLGAAGPPVARDRRLAGGPRGQPAAPGPPPCCG